MRIRNIIALVLLFSTISSCSLVKFCCPKTVVDIDGNTYNLVCVGKQIWTKQNLNTSHYKNGDIIPQVTDPIEWSKLTTGAWCYYNNDPELGKIYGKLYNWYAVNDSRGLAPDGFHIPADEEFEKLTSYLGGNLIAGGKIKQKDDLYWSQPNVGASNESGLTALPGGYRNAIGNFITLNSSEYWWSSTLIGSITAWFRYLYFGSTSCEKQNISLLTGYAVRCLKN